VSFSEGEVHALLGENGAGKSTLIKVLSGAIQPDSGDIIIDDISYSQMSPSLAQKLGIGVIYQEFNLVPSLTVAENIFLGNEICKGISVDKKKMWEEARKILKSLEVEIDPDTPVRELSIAYQQIVEITKSISKNVRILVMDEPTAPLTSTEVEALFALVKKLVSQNVTIIYITHRIEELFEISDRITILRDGNYIDTRDTESAARDELISLMVGRPLTEQYPKREHKVGQTVLEVKGLCTHSLLRDICFSVKQGEVLGISGLVGAGRTELARAIFAADEITSGEIFLHGRHITFTSPTQAIKQGLALIPEDRKNQGLLLNMDVAQNITITNIKKVSPFGVVRKKIERKLAGEYVDKLRIKTPNLSQITVNLSGGNQQKVVLAKWLASQASVYLFDEPTRGIDVGAKYEIYTLMNQLVEQGNAVIMISSELPEILGMSDRILVMSQGRIAGELSREEADQDTIMRLASGSLPENNKDERVV